MNESSRRRIKVTTSLNEISMDQLGNSVVVRGWVCFSAHTHPFLQQASGQKLSDDVYGFPSSNICFMGTSLPI
jgi:hypothetical protein